MGKKTVNFNKTGISELPDDKPVLHRIETEVGEAKLRVQERLAARLPGRVATGARPEPQVFLR